MHAWETIDQSLNYIEEHLSGEISTEELADMVGLSQFYYQRLFKRLVWAARLVSDSLRIFGVKASLFFKVFLFFLKCKNDRTGQLWGY